jgi:hypothetical protein
VVDRNVVGIEEISGWIFQHYIIEISVLAMHSLCPRFITSFLTTNKEKLDTVELIKKHIHHMKNLWRNYVHG